MIQVLREADSESVSKVAKRHGMSKQTTCVRSTRYGTLEVLTFAGCFSQLVRSQSGVSSAGVDQDHFRRQGHGPQACERRRAGKIPLPTRK